MNGIKKHSHQDRSEFIDQLIFLLQRRFKDNFVAMAAEGSYARGEDKDFSDLEITVFLKKIPKNSDWNIHKIVD